MHDKREMYGKTDMAYGHPLWLWNTRSSNYDQDGGQEQGSLKDDVPQIQWSKLGQDVYGIRQPAEKYEDDLIRVVALRDDDERVMFFERLQGKRKERTKRLLGRLGMRESPMTAIQEVEAFAAGEESEFSPEFSFTLHEHEGEAARRYWYGDGSVNGLTDTEQLLKEDCSTAFAHQVGEKLDAITAKDRVESLLAWLSPDQGKDFFKKQDARNREPFNAEKFADILEGQPKNDRDWRWQRNAKNLLNATVNSVFTKQNTLLLALKRMDDANGFIRSYFSHFRDIETLSTYRRATRKAEWDAQERVKVIGDSLQAEYLAKRSDAITAERIHRHKIFQLSYMAMRWDGRENIPVPPDTIVDRDYTTDIWRESLGAINALLLSSENDTLTAVLSRVYIALQNQQPLRNDDTLNKQLTDYLAAAVAIAKSEDHYTAIGREVEKSYGQYLSLSLSGS